MTSETYRVYTGEGEPASLDDVLAAMDTVSVVFIGERHDDAVAHHLELLLLEQAYRRYVTETDTGSARPVVLSLEMFERDVQTVLDEYLAGLITEEHFLKDSRPWRGYETGYRPLVEFARSHEVPVVASNAPRRYVNRVARLGKASLDELPDEARRWLPPLPYPDGSRAYAAKWNRLMAEMAAGHPSGGAQADTVGTDTTASGASDRTTHPEHTHESGYLFEAQVLWDAAMAHSLAEYLDRRPEALLLHVVGGFHVEEGLGLPAQLRQYRPGTARLIVAIEPVSDVSSFDAGEHVGLGDFVVLTEETASAP